MKYLEKLELINRDLHRVFPDGNNPFQIMTRLLEEGGELAEQVHIFEGSGAKPEKHGEPDPKKIAKEVQDVIGCALQVATHYGIMDEVKAGIDFRFKKRLDEGKFSADDLQRVADWPPKNVICAGAAVVYQGKILLVRQAKGTSLAGQWSIPWGLVDAGEYPNVAAIRETLEEAGVEAKIKGLIGIQHIRWQKGIGIIFMCEAVSGDPKADGVETDATRYFDLSELDNLDEPLESSTEWISRRVLNGRYTLIPLADSYPFAPLDAFF